MNHAFAIARRRAEQVRAASCPREKRRHILFCLDALRVGLSINDGKGQASPGEVHQPAFPPPSPIHRAERAGYE